MFDLEDLSGIVRCILWPDDYEKHGVLVQPDAIVIARGTVDRRPGSEEANLIIQELIPLDAAAGRFARGIRVRLVESLHQSSHVDRLHEILRCYPGNGRVECVLQFDDGGRLLLECEGLQVDINLELRTRIDDLLGPGNVKVLSSRNGRSPTGGPTSNPKRTNQTGRMAVVLPR
jgi:DNA polymerase-3 subunit alpha